MPFTQAEFFAVFADYNAAIWPLQLVAYLLGIAAIGLTFCRTRTATVMISAILALMWFINGGAYHWSFFAEINPVARFFGIVFLLQAVLIAGSPFVSKPFRISAKGDARTVVGLGLAAFAALVYPALGWLAGHVYPATPVFGVAPCPTTIFTIGLLLLGSWNVARWLLVTPVVWAVIGGSAAVLLDVPQDFGLIVALLVVVGFTIAVARNARFAHHDTTGT